jgi:epoxide hydrolase-like predicted phosphatase
MAMVKAVILDFDGVLIRAESHNAHHAWDERLGLPTGSVERAIHHSDLWIQAQLGRISYQAYWKGVAELLYTSPDVIPELRRDFFSGDRLNYKLVDYIRELRKHDIQIALLCNATAHLKKRLEEFGVQDIFDHVLISAEIGVMKPDPTAFRVALQALGTAPQETIYVDDSYINVRAAQSVNLDTILFRPDTDLRSVLSDHLGTDGA